MMKLPAAPRYKLNDNDVVLAESDQPYILRVRDLPSAEKPREKMLSSGPHNLAVAELVAILLGVGTKKEEVMSMAQRILKDYGEKSIMNEINPQRLSDTLQIPIGKACQIVASFELGRRFFEKRNGRPVFVRTTKQAFHHLKGMSDMKKEQLCGLYLNSRYQIIHQEVISVGSLTANIVHPREVFRPAMEYGAVGVIIAHNHPSGSLEPTYADLEATTQLVAAGKVLGIDLLDHLIIANTKYASIIEGQT